MLPHDLRALLIDLDGVVYRGETLLPGALELVPTLERLGIAHAFVTNNATLGAEGYIAKLRALGIPAEPGDVVTSAEATATYLRAQAEPGARVCVVGEAGLLKAIKGAGFELADENAQYVVVGLDRQVTYQRLVVACTAILEGATFIGTNPDRAFPVETGLWPGAGSIIAAVATATGVTPTIIGKPAPTLLLAALTHLGVAPEHAIMIGDQVATDVRAGKAAGVATVLVEGDLAQGAAETVPDLTVRDLSDLLARLPFP